MVGMEVVHTMMMIRTMSLTKYGTRDPLVTSKQISGKDSIRYDCVLASYKLSPMSWMHGTQIIWSPWFPAKKVVCLNLCKTVKHSKHEIKIVLLTYLIFYFYSTQRVWLFKIIQTKKLPFGWIKRECMQNRWGVWGKWIL